MREKLTTKVFSYGILILIALITFVPLVYILLSSFKESILLRTPGVWIPPKFVLEQWNTVLALGYQYNLLHSLYIAVGSAALGLIIVIPGAYVFARKDFYGRNILFYFVITSLLFPLILLIIPLTSTMMDLGLYNTYVAVWIVLQLFVVPFGLWVLRGYFAGLPSNLEDAAMIFGSSEFQAFYKVIVPIAMPGVVAVGFQAFLAGWNDFLISNMLLSSEQLKPATVSLYALTVGSERTYWGNLMPMVVMTTIPPIVLYITSQRWLKGFSGA